MLVISVFVCVCVLGCACVSWATQGGVFAEGDQNVLGSVGSVVHEQKLNIVDVVDEEGLVAGGHHVAGLLVGTIANLQIRCVSTVFHLEARASHRDDCSSIDAIQGGCTYGGHGNGASEASSNSGVDTLGPSPAGADTLEAVTLVTFEALRAYSHELILSPSQSVPIIRRRSIISTHLQKLHRTSAAGMFVRGQLYVRFLTMGTCFLAETIYANVNNSVFQCFLMHHQRAARTLTAG